MAQSGGTAAPVAKNGLRRPACCRIAHDFNNMLTIIQGHTGALLAKARLPSDALDSLHAVFFAAERAASLTRQLLMFSRKNVMQSRFSICATSLAT